MRNISERLIGGVRDSQEMKEKKDQPGKLLVRVLLSSLNSFPVSLRLTSVVLEFGRLEGLYRIRYVLAFDPRSISEFASLH